MCPAYVAAKHAVIGITRTFANELGKYNIQTNAIAPGFFVTDVNKEISSNKEFYDKITGRIPAGRWGETADLMGTAVFLASSARTISTVGQSALTAALPLPFKNSRAAGALVLGREK